MSTKFSFLRDINGYNSFGLMPALNKQATTLSANTAQTFTAPTDEPSYAAVLMLPPGATVWVALNTTATLPSSSVADSTSELNPPLWFVNAGDTISVITADTTGIAMGIKFYAT